MLRANENHIAAGAALNAMQWHLSVTPASMLLKSLVVRTHKVLWTIHYGLKHLHKHVPFLRPVKIGEITLKVTTDR